VILVDPHVRDLVRHDQMVLRIDGALHVVADRVGAVALRCHRARIRIGQRDLFLTRGLKLRLECRQAVHLGLERLDASAQRRDLGGSNPYAGHLRLAIRTIKLGEIASDALVDRSDPPLQAVVREVLLAVVHGLELAAVDRDARLVEKVEVAAERDEPATYLADRRTVVLTENRRSS